jgi:hypothetical protein
MRKAFVWTWLSGLSFGITVGYVLFEWVIR